METPVKIDYRPNFDDTYHGVQFGWWGTPRRVLRSVVLMFVVPGALFGWLFKLSIGSQLSFGLIAIAAICFGVGWGCLFIFLFSAWWASYLVRIQRARGNPQQIIVTDDGIERVLSNATIKHAWAGISHIEETGRVFFLFDATGPVASIEKSALESDAELDELRSFLRGKKPGKYLGGRST